MQIFFFDNNTILNLISPFFCFGVVTAMYVFFEMQEFESLFQWLSHFTHRIKKKTENGDYSHFRQYSTICVVSANSPVQRRVDW